MKSLSMTVRNDRVRQLKRVQTRTGERMEQATLRRYGRVSRMKKVDRPGCFMYLARKARKQGEDRVKRWKDEVNEAKRGRDHDNEHATMYLDERAN